MRFLFVVLLMSLSQTVNADESCYDSEPIITRQEVWDFTAVPQSDFHLPSRNINGIFITEAAAHFTWGENLEVFFDFNLPPHLFGLAYNVHRIEIKVGDYVHKMDLTFNCTEPGLSLFPRQTIKIPAWKLPRPTSMEMVELRIWGHL